MLTLPAKVLGPSDISPTHSDQTGERKHSQNGTGNEADSGETSELPYYNICVCIYIDFRYRYIYIKSNTNRQELRGSAVPPCKLYKIIF